MHTNILTKNQLDLIPIVTGFGKKGYYLVGGTALALQLGHRRSLDYDLFTKNSFDNKRYEIVGSVTWPGVIQMPDVLTIAAMKAFALGQRAKWKDYVDLYFVMKKYSLKDIVEKARELFGSEVNDRIFREQLSYFDDINYNEQPDYLPGFEVPNEEIKRVLADVACTE